MFGACILLMMAILAVYVMVYAAAEESSNDSYSLVIQKVFAENTPGEVLEQAKERTYTFKIEGTKRGEGGTYEPIEPKTITLSQKDGWSYKEIFGVPYNVTVTEITDNIAIAVHKDGKTHYYNMSDSRTDAAIPVNSRTHELELKNNSKLLISRPEGSDGPELLCYRVTNRLEDEHASPTFEKLDTVFFLRAGEEMEIESLPSGKLLCAGIYTVEQIAAPDGYQLQMGTRNADVNPGNTGHFYINGTPGQLTLTAGGTRGDGAAHYYTVERTEEEGDETPFETRTIKIDSGENCVLDNLPKGGYVVT